MRRFSRETARANAVLELPLRNFLVENDAVADQLKRSGRALATPAQLLVAFALIPG